MAGEGGCMTVEAHAKINWTLEVLGVRPDGYHDLRSVVLPIPLHDTVSLEASETISCDMSGMSDVGLPSVSRKTALVLS